MKDLRAAERQMLHDVNARLEKQDLLLQTLVRLLLEKGVIQRDELSRWVDYVDSLDGSVDGKLKSDRRPRECPKCRRKNSPQARHCQYCGAELGASFLSHDPK